jgi:2-dehydropantoate 2-reductase
MANVAALELSGWSLAALRRGRWLPIAAVAARQSMRIAAARLGVRPPFSVHLLSGLTLRLMWTVAPWVLALDLETYLRYHFTKVSAQTRQLLAESRRDGEARGLAVSDITTLLDALGGPS